MKRRITTVAVGVVAIAGTVALPSAVAAYTSTKLEVTQSGATTVAKISASPDDDPTAAARVFAPAGTRLTTNQAPGTRIGTAKASAKALGLAGADVPLTGSILVAAPGQVPLASQNACLQGVSPLATWIMALDAAGQMANFPLFLVATTGPTTALGPAYVQICLPPPDVPESQGGAPFGLKLYGATLSITGVFSPVSLGAWIAFWTPYTPGAGTPNVGGTIATPAAVAPGGVAIVAKKSGRGAVVTGAVTQAGQPRGAATVTITGGATKAKLTTTKRVRVGATGKFRATFAVGTFFRATAVATPAAAAPLCAQLSAALAPIPCVNPTVNGFTVKSKLIKKK